MVQQSSSNGCVGPDKLTRENIDFGNCMLRKIFPQRLKNYYHLGQAILAGFIYGFPGRSKSIKIIGVTGTDGKTTTVQMITKILEEAGRKVAMASTINYKIGEREWKNVSHFTTLSSFAIQKFILEAVKDGCEYLVLETSSHSLDQFRVWGIQYHTAVITNVTREHLDYHKNMERYRAAKCWIFRNAKNAVVNLDMEKPEKYLDCGAENIWGYTTSDQELMTNDQKIKIVKAENVELGANYSTYKLKSKSYKLNLPGLFNIENALAATCVGMVYGIKMETIKTALEKIKSVPGRMESVPNKRELNILVDFALTPNALEKLYTLLEKIRKPGSEVIAVFGACGERDRGKRPIIGGIVSRYADKLIITNDEPYHEDPLRIINEIITGVKDKKENEDFWIIPDRREAIKKALGLARPQDIIAVTGMGAEESMVVGGKKIPWNDRTVIEELLRELG
jgi:UDP-N-acetylmuramoyl-L-alanyl-D-glutamate--2,6-diaminopimelate ligase